MAFFEMAGHDVQLADPFQKGVPTEKDVIPTVTVPGAVLPGDNVYAVSQSLSWLAKERRDVQEQLEWKHTDTGIVRTSLQITPLIKRLSGGL